ncbi:MAG: AraC family transcriptional regulator, partial [Jannaschia sp.]
METDLMALVSASDKSTPLADRVRSCLIEAITEGDPSIAFVCERLAKSRSSLLRELRAHGETFQGLLEDTR